LVRAAVAAGVDLQPAATHEGTRHLERRLKSWQNTGGFCAIRRDRRGRRAAGR
jgi:hypothetical protein